tara:strand:- start:63 stop:512 length:450 start_codon:yes stop_codon:yes gene_type:complete
VTTTGGNPRTFLIQAGENLKVWEVHSRTNSKEKEDKSPKRSRKEMEHVTLTCKHHRNLRWHCKEVAVNGDGSYNGSRNIFFEGSTTSKGIVVHREADGSTVQECPCPPSDMTFAPKDGNTDGNDNELPISVERFKAFITQFNEEVRGIG